jgi:hypothetical protein
VTYDYFEVGPAFIEDGLNESWEQFGMLSFFELLEDLVFLVILAKVHDAKHVRLEDLDVIMDVRLADDEGLIVIFYNSKFFICVYVFLDHFLLVLFKNYNSVNQILLNNWIYKMKTYTNIKYIMVNKY